MPDRVTIYDEYMREWAEADPRIVRAIREINNLPKANKKDHT
jgi:hypothetical protein